MHMSSPGQDLLQQQSGTPLEKEPALVDLNQVVREVLQPYLASGRHQEVIFRCDQLPYTSGKLYQIQQVFRELLGMIMNWPSEGKRFLYVACEPESRLAGFTEVASRFRIGFYTNLKTDENWKQQHQETILACTGLLAVYDAFLSVHDILNTGCIFSLSLPGKLV